MEKHESTATQADSALPRPVVLRPEDLAAVAAAGVAILPTALGRIIIAGGIPPAPYMSTAAMY